MRHEQIVRASFAILAIIGVIGTPYAQEHHDADSGHEPSSNAFRVDALRNWIFRDFLPDSDDSLTYGAEIDSSFGIGNFAVKNISYFEVADYPRAVPGKPVGNPTPGMEAATGITDLLSAFLFSRKDAPHGAHHFAWGFAGQLPTASDDALGSGKYSLGPTIDYEYTNGNLFTGFIALQLWSVAGESDRKEVSMMMIKPFAYYTLNEKWDLVYEPYGISVYWNKPSGQKAYVPLGGGVQRKAQLGKVPMVFSLQGFKYVVRPDAGSEYDLRLLVEIDF